jgi:hypothetical protein
MTHETARMAPASGDWPEDQLTTRSLGLLPAKGAESIMLSTERGTLTGVRPSHSPTADHFAAIRTWVLGGNDRFGTCGPTSVANARRLITAYLAGAPDTFTDEQVFDLYRRSGNPNFDPATGADDNGVDMQTMCEALMSGGFAGVKPVCFAQVDATNLDDVRACEEIFGSVLLGVTLQDDQNVQTDTGLWHYSPSPTWGGHAIMSGRYTDPAGTVDDRTGVISWRLVVDTADDFLVHQCDQVWVVIWPEHLGTKEFIEGVNLSVLAADYEALTGRPFPSVPQPVPVPDPVPSPGVPTKVDLALAKDAHAWLDHPNRWGRATNLRRSLAAWFDQEHL